MSKTKAYLLTLLVMVIFVTAWAFLSANIPAWSDEITHMAVAKGLLLNRTFTPWDFDTAKPLEGVFPGGLYTRGRAISYLTKVLYQFFGFSLISSRIMPLAFTFLTFFTYAFYVRKRFRVSYHHIFVAAILFFGQSMVLEKSMYVRIYAPLALVQIVSLIIFWEGAIKFENKKILGAIIFWATGFVVTVLPILDTWQYQQVPIFLLGVLVYVVAVNPKVSKYIEKKRFMMIILSVAFILLAPCLAIVLSFLMTKLPIGNRSLGFTFFTYWDNIAGIIRYVWTINLCLVMPILMFFQKKPLKWNFGTWLLITGVISGFFTGLYEPHNFIFYSRFFYLPVVLTILGAAFVFAGSGLGKERIKRILVVYLLLNAALSILTFHFDRSNITKPIKWLNQNIKGEDLLVVFYSELALNGGDALVKNAFSVSNLQNEEGAKKLLNFIENHQEGDIYFLYTDHHQLRNDLYRFTTGESRTSPSDLFHYLKDSIRSQKVISGLRGCGLLKFDRRDIVAGLKDVIKNGYVKPYKSHELKMLRNIKNGLLKHGEEKQPAR